MRAAVDFESFPSPARSQSDSTSRSDRPRTKAPITSARSGSVRSTLVARGEQPRDERLGGLADLREFELKLALQRPQLAGRKPLRSPRWSAGAHSGPCRARRRTPLPRPAGGSVAPRAWRAPRATPAGSHPPQRQAADRSALRAPPTALRFFSRRRSPFLVLQDFGEPTPCP